VPVVGVGIDVVPVDRFAATLRRTPALAERLFVPPERVTLSGEPRTPESLAARFAAKEAVAKALGSPGSMAWHDCEIVSTVDGAPQVTVRGSVAAAARTLGIQRWHLSLSHDGGIASAMVVAET
jgi:holo-[acyl-carrier protein] synthase